MTTNMKIGFGITLMAGIFNALVGGYCASTKVCGMDAFGISFFVNILLVGFGLLIASSLITGNG